jgi:3-oxoacyl-[acyl-carrier protein] reductase
MTERPVAWVTGASRGLGANTALELARAGFDIALTARGQARLDEIADSIRSLGSEALPLASDLTLPDSVATFADAALERFGRCDVLCNIGVYQGVQGRLVASRFMDTPMDEFRLSLEAGVVAPAYLCQRVIGSMRTHGGGTIINMSSSVVYLEVPGPPDGSGWSLAYSSAKAGIDQFAKTLNVEFADAGIRIFNVEPGFVVSGPQLLEKIRKYPGIPACPPESIGPAIAWLVTRPEADALLSERIKLPELTYARGLLPGWDGPGTMWPSPGSLGDGGTQETLAAP